MDETAGLEWRTPAASIHPHAWKLRMPADRRASTIRPSRQTGAESRLPCPAELFSTLGPRTASKSAA